MCSNFDVPPYTFRMLLTVLMRSRVFLLFVISISLPIAVATVLSGSIALLYSQTGLILDLYSKQPSVLVRMSPYNSSCTATNILYIDIVYRNRSFSVQVHSVWDLDLYLEIMGIRITKRMDENYRCFFSLGRGVSELYGIDVGSSVTLCLGGHCSNRTVVAIHSGNSYLNHIAIVDSETYRNGHRMYFCKSGYNYALQGIARNFGKNTESIAGFLSTATVVPYLVVTYLAVDRVWNMCRDELAVLYTIGLNPSSLWLYFYTVALFVAFLSVAYGISIGVVALYLGLWFLKLLGMHVFTTTVPLPTFGSLAIPILMSLLTASISTAIVARRTGVRT